MPPLAELWSADPVKRLETPPDNNPASAPIVHLWITVGARDWNVRDSGAGYVTRFEVRKNFLDHYQVQDAGGQAHREYWIPADQVDAFNQAIVGQIEIVRSFP